MRGSEERAALRSARRVLRGRAGLPSRTDLAYAVYLGIMLVIIVVSPIVRAAILALAEILPEEPGPSTAPLSVGTLAGIVALAALAGAHTGPASLKLPEIDLLLASPIRRRRVLARPVLRAFIAAAVAGVFVVAVVLAAYGSRGPLGWSLVLGGVLSGAAVGVMLAVAMLVGQRGRASRWTLAASAGLISIGCVLMARVLLASSWSGSSWAEFPWAGFPWAEFPWTEFSRTAPSGSPWALLSAGAILVAVLTIAGLLVTPAILNAVSRDAMRAQAVRLDVAGVLLHSGDVRIAAARLGSPVRVGRSWRWRMPRRLQVAIFARDLVGIARSPARSAAALAAAIGTGAIIAATVTEASNVALSALLGALALLVAYGSFGPWTRGLRSAAETVGGSPLTPRGPGWVLLRHAVAPGLLGVLVVAGSSAAAGIFGGFGAADPLLAAVSGVVVAVAALLLRLAGALKGPLPQTLLAPVPTPVGDVSGLNVALWSLDGLIVAALIGGLLGAVVAASTFSAAVIAAVVLALLVTWVSWRLRNAAG